MRLIHMTAAVALGLGTVGCLDVGDGGLKPIVPDSGTSGGEPDAAPVDEPDAAPPPSPTQALAEWSGCMILQNWTAANMGSWANAPTEGGTVCASCHAAGLENFNTNPDPELMFEYNRYEVFITGFFTVAPDGVGGFDVVPGVDKLRRVGAGENAHPTFPTGNNNIYMQRLQQFYDLTVQAKQIGACGPAQFPQPQQPDEDPGL